jgi:hypothetical protein
MSFRLVVEKLNDQEGNFISCKDFFKFIRMEKNNNPSSPLKTDMDSFMLCVILGLKLDKKEKINDYKLQSTPFISEYTDSYQKVREPINGLLLSKLMKLKSIKNDNKDKIKELLQEVLDTNQSTFLKKGYVELLHEYYLGGYCVLLNQFNNKAPEEVSIFFEKYNNLIKN